MDSLIKVEQEWMLAQDAADEAKSGLGVFEAEEKAAAAKKTAEAAKVKKKADEAKKNRKGALDKKRKD